jgi:peptidoglycan/xylan/chitin deacetylase (PgdA/CDA1 family)
VNGRAKSHSVIILRHNVQKLKLPILCYHKVSPVQESGRWLNIEPQRFKSHLRFFCRRHYRFVRASELPTAIERSVCITFDDAYTSALTHGLDTLKACGAKATYYVVGNHVGGASEWDGERRASLGGWDMLKAAEQYGCEMGNHTANHPRLGSLNLEQQVNEFESCHEALMRHGLLAQTACYPYGEYNDESVLAIQKMKYHCALSIGKWPVSRNPFTLSRIVISYSDAMPKLLYKLLLRPLLP